jgi:hypothetical protein
MDVLQDRLLDNRSEVRRFEAATKSEAERSVGQAMIETAYVYERVGYDRRQMAFLADGSIGVGAAGRERWWDIRQQDGRMVLEIASETEVTCRLVQDEAGVWRGPWLHAERMPIAVYPSTLTIPDAWETQHRNREGADPGTHADRAVKVGIGGQFTRPLEVRVFTDTHGGFATVHDSHVLIYFRHGFGDWVQFATILPLLDPSNRYWMVRFGDDYTSVMEGSEFVTPLYLGRSSIHCGDGGDLYNQHFGIDGDRGDGSQQTLHLPLALHDVCVAQEIDAVLCPTFPEIYGHSIVPYHTKARCNLPFLVERRGLDPTTLCAPLKTAINFAVDPWILNWVRARLRNDTGYGDRKLCLISRNGFTHVGKNWGHRWREEMPAGRQQEGEECRDFMRLMLHKDPRWVFLVMEDELFQGDDTLRSEALHAYSFVELFGKTSQATVPFGLILKALVNMADLAIGVPTGPYHLCMAKPELPTVGLWIEHLPSWYDEPKPNSVHVISRNVVDLRLDQRSGSFTQAADLAYQCLWGTTRIITGQQVMDAVEALID